MINANAKFQMQSDSLHFDLGMHRVADVPQLFFDKKNRLLFIFTAKIVYDIFIAGKTSAVHQLLHTFSLISD